MSICGISEKILAYSFFFMLFFAIFSTVISRVSFIYDTRKTEKEIPKFHVIKSLFYMGLAAQPPWIKDKKLLKRHRYISLIIPLVVFFMLITLAFLGIALVQYCDAK